jgi:hypothetical protein
VLKAAEAVIGDLSKEITLDALKNLLSPLAKITNIIDALGMLVDPKYWAEPVRHMIRYKEELAAMDPSKDHDQIEGRLDWEEYDVMWWTRWWGWDIRSAGRMLWWDLSTTLVDLGPVPDVFWDLGLDIQKKLHHRVLKKFSWKFGDYLWGAMHNPSDVRPWRVKVDEAFITGYNCAIKCGYKQLGLLLSHYASEFLKRPVLGAIEKHIMPQIESLIAPLQQQIPEPVTSIIDINGIVQSALLDSVAMACDTVIDGVKPAFVEELAHLPAAAAGAAATASTTAPVAVAATSAAPLPEPTAPPAPAAEPAPAPAPVPAPEPAPAPVAEPEPAPAPAPVAPENLTSSTEVAPVPAENSVAN